MKNKQKINLEGEFRTVLEREIKKARAKERRKILNYLKKYFEDGHTIARIIEAKLK